MRWSRRCATASSGFPPILCGRTRQRVLLSVVGVHQGIDDRLANRDRRHVPVLVTPKTPDLSPRFTQPVATRVFSSATRLADSLCASSSRYSREGSGSTTKNIWYENTPRATP